MESASWLCSWCLDTTVWLNTGWNLSPFHRQCLNQFLFGAIPSNNLFYRWILMRYGSEQLIFLTVLTRNTHLLCIAAVNDMGWISDCPVLHDIVYDIKPWKILHWYFIITLVPFAALPVLVDHIFIAFLQWLDLVPTLFRGSFVIVSRQNLHDLLFDPNRWLWIVLSLHASMSFAVSVSEQVLPRSAIFF